MAYQLVILVIHSAIFISGSLSQSCEVFNQINETLYDRTYRSITENAARPIGFKKATQYFSSSSGNTVPCFSATGLQSNQQVEVMFETVPSSTLCVRVKNGSPDEDFGCHERFSTCLHSSMSTVEFEFYCKVSDGCSESNVNFWVRITTGVLPANDPEGMWCMWRNVEYPESLALIPDFVTPPPDTGDTSGTVNTTHVSAWFLTLIAITVYTRNMLL